MERRWRLAVLLVACCVAGSTAGAGGRKGTKHLVVFLDEQDAPENPASGNPDPMDAAPSPPDPDDGSASDPPSDDLDEFGDLDDYAEEDLDPGAWKAALEERAGDDAPADSLYWAGVRGLLFSASESEPEVLERAVHDFQAAADHGHAHSQSALAFLYGSGIGLERNDLKSFLYHSFASHGGNLQSKMALAYTYLRRQMNEEAVKLYAELAATAVASFVSSKESPLVEPVRLNNGLEENKDDLRKSRGEDDDDFQILEYQARKGNAGAMYRVGVFYYFGLRGVHRDHSKALHWFLKAVEKGDSTATELLGEIYARGLGTERNFTKAMEWFKAASKHKRFSAYNGIGYLYVKGHGVEKNYTMARDFFKLAAEYDDPNGNYNLGVLYLKGKGVTKDVDAAIRHFGLAAKKGHPKAYYQLAKLVQNGIGVRKDIATAALFYKIVAERGPWGSLLRWALESYLKGDIGRALLLYTRAAELGYEVAQSNAAWILEKYSQQELCIGTSGQCTVSERHQRAHSLWWHASEQGNDDAALLIGDAYYYGYGTEIDLERAAEAYKHARSQANAQAIFNLGYMHEHGLGLPLDLHLAKRYYDEALQTDPAAALPVTLALMSLWLRQHYGNSFLVKIVDCLPHLQPKVSKWLKEALLDEGNATLITLFVFLMTVLYLRQRQRRIAVQAMPPPPA